MNIQQTKKVIVGHEAENGDSLKSNPYDLNEENNDNDIWIYNNMNVL